MGVFAGRGAGRWPLFTVPTVHSSPIADRRSPIADRRSPIADRRSVRRFAGSPTARLVRDAYDAGALSL
ncbi:hypothetical protein E0500_018125 [Streptomyces sp. KM273126]|uniref:hypothetical protein n=1 Tax=Streptomyces sp. KM273126 TaxID=2545247 RepID=UPI00103F6175|nr:hypothetical protein [Streptomyces sp. KM273126]MBA2809263.1 hypothetical protein [Streptomyces sp. KM273126]